MTLRNLLPVRALRLAAAAVALLLSLGVGAAFAQAPPSLAEIAKQEAARRKAVKGSGKVFTNADLPKSTAPPAPSAAGQAAPSEQKPQEPPKQEEKDENWWRGRITAVRESLRRNEMFLEALQTRINSLASDFASRDDPFQRAKLAEDRVKALNEMERVKADIEQDKKQIAEIEEEARQAGVPAGWLR